MLLKVMVQLAFMNNFRLTLLGSLVCFRHRPWSLARWSKPNVVGNLYAAPAVLLTLPEFALHLRFTRLVLIAKVCYANQI